MHTPHPLWLLASYTFFVFITMPVVKLAFLIRTFLAPFIHCIILIKLAYIQKLDIKCENKLFDILVT